MMRALVIVHDPGSVPSLVGERLEEHGFQLELLQLTQSPEDPTSDVPFPNLSGIDLVVPMGAIWSVYDVTAIGSWVDRELEFLRAAHAANIPILGICFGGQALAAALGGASIKSAQSQLGWVKIETSVDGITTGPWMEWHHDEIQPPPDAEVLAFDDTYVQAFRVGTSVGTQFHPEVDLAHIDMWLGMGGAEELEAHGVDIAALRARTIEVESVARTNARALVDWFVHDVAGISTQTGELAR